MEQNFKNLHRAALEMATRLIATLDDRQNHAIAKAASFGAGLSVEIGPMPDAHTAAVFLNEPDGSRSLVAKITIDRVVLQ